MEYFLNLPTVNFDNPETWATGVERQGWHGICASDHFWVSHAYPHVFVTAARMSAVTSKIVLTTSFCNNLFRSPVEFAQAALALQQASGGRFEAGLGAGWLESEMQASGMDYPAPSERISRYVEALKITSALLVSGQCQFEGLHYKIDIAGENRLGPISSTPPPLIGSVGGPRGIREVSPLVDRIEIKASSRGTRGGSLDIPALASVTEDDIRLSIERVKTAAPQTPISIFLMISVGESKEIKAIKALFGDSFLGRFHGHPDSVGAALDSLSDFGIDRIQLTEMTPGSQDALAPVLIG